MHRAGSSERSREDAQVHASFARNARVTAELHASKMNK